jgi:hypothetical protein
MVVVHHELRQILHIGTQDRVFTHTEVSGILRVQQIVNLLIVYLDDMTMIRDIKTGGYLTFQRTSI